MDIDQKNELERLRGLKKISDLKYLEDEKNKQELDELQLLRDEEKLKQFENLKDIGEIRDSLKNLVDLKNEKETTERDLIIIEELRKEESENELEGLIKFYMQLKNISEYGKIDETNEWLRWIHNRYFEKFLKDNDRIWAVTSIFIPLSLAGLSSIKEGTLISTSLLATASIGLISFWYLICEKHRAFQEQSIALVRVIERFIGIDTEQIETKQALYTKDKNWSIALPRFIILFFKIKIQRARALMLYLVISLWLLAVCWSWKKSSNITDSNSIIHNKTVINSNQNKSEEFK